MLTMSTKVQQERIPPKFMRFHTSFEKKGMKL